MTRVTLVVLVAVAVGCGGGAAGVRDTGVGGRDATGNADSVPGESAADVNADRVSADATLPIDGLADVAPLAGDGPVDGVRADRAPADDLLPDRAPLDGGRSDSAPLDAPATDSPLADSTRPDGQRSDSAPLDAPATDSPLAEAAPTDSSPSDMAFLEVAHFETGSSDSAPAIDGSPSAGSSQACSPVGWCWVHPLPTGNDLNAVLVRSASDVWVAGWFDTLLHWDGTGWTQFHVGSHYLWGLSAEPGSDSAPGAVWVVGAAGLAARFDGQVWTGTDTGTQVTLRGVWAVARNQVYAVGDGGTLLFWDGVRWTPIALADQTRTETRDLLAAWGSGPDDVWVGGSSGALWHKQGSVWGEPLPASSNSWTVITGSGAASVWMINDSGDLMRWNGSTLSIVRDAQVFPPTGIWAGADNDVWVTRYQSVEHWDGAVWSAIKLGYNLTVLAGTASNQVWGVGQRGALARWNGRTWAPLSQNQLPYGVTSLWAGSPNDVWMSSMNFLYHWDGQAVAAVASPGGHQIKGIWGSGPNDVWTAGINGEVQHWNGVQWALATGTGLYELSAISGSGASDIWAVGPYSAYHFDGASWSLRNTGVENTALLAVFVAGPTQAWAGGFNDFVTRWDGLRWNAETLPGSTRTYSNQTIAGTGPTDVWAFGEQAYHFDGQSWQAVAGAPIAQHAWGSRPNDWWGIVAGLVNHYDGSTWKEVPVDASSPVGLTGFGSNDVWIGCNGGLLHRSGGALP